MVEKRAGEKLNDRHILNVVDPPQRRRDQRVTRLMMSYKFASARIDQAVLSCAPNPGSEILRARVMTCVNARPLAVMQNLYVGATT
jgi:hypothetical protein